MRRLLAGLAAGLTLGVMGTAGAVAATDFWKGGGAQYQCHGNHAIMSCAHSSGYELTFTKDLAGITYHRDLAAVCYLRRSPTKCRMP